MIENGGAIGVGIEQVRGQRDLGGPQPLDQRIQRREQGGVGVEIDDDVGARGAGLVEEGALHRRAGLDHVMLEQPAGIVGDPQILGPDHPVEGLVFDVEMEAERRPVGDQGHQLPVGVEPAQGLIEHPGAVQIGKGETGIAEDLHAPSSRSMVSAL
ncbi:hypothetical protein GALL_554300 [mine drainage metagenome]|uniref:Uncharacterized protein n=1 Tax=mine drainage metagenome TaxID=410659 RepID=A0A1J5P6H9_9ZZZZ